MSLQLEQKRTEMILDYEKWLRLAKKDGSADPSTIQLMHDAVKLIEEQVSSIRLLEISLLKLFPAQ